jgi:hypothetical protein
MMARQPLALTDRLRMKTARATASKNEATPKLEGDARLAAAAAEADRLKLEDQRRAAVQTELDRGP